ncbi:MAG: hypothetical protein VCA55_11930 [Verrucomicrobiales bacterium]
MNAAPCNDSNSNSIRLSPREWLVALGIFVVIAIATPTLWRHTETLETDLPDYRVPYVLSNDYWVYAHHVRQMSPGAIPVVGDSVVWGEYVSRNGTLSHFLSGQTDHSFVNAGVNGLYPLALEGLIEHHGSGIRNRKVLLHCNLLWLSSPERDLQAPKEQTFNHPLLIPQFSVRIPSYRAKTETRITRAIENRIPFLTWINHLQEAHFGQQSIPQWTVAQAEDNPDSYPNSYANPLAQIRMSIPGEPVDDPERGTGSPRHKPWAGSPQNLDWVALENSLQWQAFQRLVNHLQSRGNNVYVVVGPLNQHKLTETNRDRLLKLENGAAKWLRESNIPHWIADTLPSKSYADASHPLTQGYRKLAEKILGEESFTEWLAR